MEAAELRDIQRAARRQRMTVSEWVRGALRNARRTEPQARSAPKLEAIRAASAHAFPAGDIEQMLDEIERGRGQGDA